MAEAIRIAFPDGSDPIKLFKNRNRRGVIIRQGPAGIFVDSEVGQQVVDALTELLEEVDQ